MIVCHPQRRLCVIHRDDCVSSTKKIVCHPQRWLCVIHKDDYVSSTK